MVRKLDHLQELEEAERAGMKAILFKDLPVLPMWYQNAVAVTPKDVKGFEFTWQQKPQYYKLTK